MFSAHPTLLSRGHGKGLEGPVTVGAHGAAAAGGLVGEHQLLVTQGARRRGWEGGNGGGGLVRHNTQAHAYPTFGTRARTINGKHTNTNIRSPVLAYVQ